MPLVSPVQPNFYVVGQPQDVDAHIAWWNLVEARYSPLPEILHRQFTAEPMLQIRGRKLNERLEKVARLCAGSAAVPQSLQDLVGFPPIAEVV